jgi:GNAT superfamily N-acetyltransferase
MRVVDSTEVELIEAEASASLLEAFALASGGQIAEVRRWGRAATLVVQHLDTVAVNRAIGFGFERPLDLAQLAEIRAFYREAGKSRWFLDCSPDASIDQAMLVSAGGVSRASVVKLVATLDDIDDPPMPNIRVVDVDAGDATRFAALVGPLLGVPEPVRPAIVSTIGFPGWRFYFAVDAGEPVAGAAMFTHGDGAWLGLMATLPEYRQRGAQTALLARRIQDARAAGCRWISAETSPETAGPNRSLRNMKRVGLRELYHRPFYRFDERESQPS